MSGNQLELTGVATVFQEKKKSIDLTAWDFLSFFFFFSIPAVTKVSNGVKAGQSGARRKKVFTVMIK